MKRLLIILLSALSLTAYAQGKKTVAVLDPICRDNSVNVFFQQMVRGAMESAITASSEYKAYDRSAFDQIQKEQAFQRTGAVNDSQIKKMGELAGVDYVLVSEVSAYEGYLSTIIKILNVTTGEYDKSVDDYMELKPESVKNKCREMASSLFGSSPSKTPTSNNQVPVGYVDLGLPSGTLWKKDNEAGGFYTYDQAIAKFGSDLPTKEQLEELKSSCKWTWTGNGYRVEGPNGQSIVLPAAGWRYCYGSVDLVGSCGFYWSSTRDGSDYAWSLHFKSGKVSMYYSMRCNGLSVRLVR